MHATRRSRESNFCLTGTPRNLTERGPKNHVCRNAFFHGGFPGAGFAALVCDAFSRGAASGLRLHPDGGSCPCAVRSLGTRRFRRARAQRGECRDRRHPDLGLHRPQHAAALRSDLSRPAEGRPQPVGEQSPAAQRASRKRDPHLGPGDQRQCRRERQRRGADPGAHRRGLALDRAAGQPALRLDLRHRRAGAAASARYRAHPDLDLRPRDRRLLWLQPHHRHGRASADAQRRRGRAAPRRPGRARRRLPAGAGRGRAEADRGGNPHLPPPLRPRRPVRAAPAGHRRLHLRLFRAQGGRACRLARRRPAAAAQDQCRRQRLGRDHDGRFRPAGTGQARPRSDHRGRDRGRHRRPAPVRGCGRSRRSRRLHPCGARHLCRGWHLPGDGPGGECGYHRRRNLRRDRGRGPAAQAGHHRQPRLSLCRTGALCPERRRRDRKALCRAVRLCADRDRPLRGPDQGRTRLPARDRGASRDHREPGQARRHRPHDLLRRPRLARLFRQPARDHALPARHRQPCRPARPHRLFARRDDGTADPAQEREAARRPDHPDPRKLLLRPVQRGRPGDRRERHRRRPGPGPARHRRRRADRRRAARRGCGLGQRIPPVAVHRRLCLGALRRGRPGTVRRQRRRVDHRG